MIDIVPIPHYDMPARTAEIDRIKQKYASQFPVVLLTDDQAIVAEGDNWKVVDSARSPLEHKWFSDNHDKL